MNSLFELCYAYHMIGFCFFFIRHFSVQIAIFPFICAIRANNPSYFIYATLLKMEMSWKLCAFFFSDYLNIYIFYALSSGTVMSLSYFGFYLFKFQLLELYTPLLPSLCYKYVNFLCAVLLPKNNKFEIENVLMRALFSNFSSRQKFNIVYGLEAFATWMRWMGRFNLFSNLTNLHNSINSIVAEKAFLGHRTTPTILRICMNFTHFI